MWEQIESVVASLPVTAGTVRVYQDGLPVCGHEREIVSELAGAGTGTTGCFGTSGARRDADGHGIARTAGGGIPTGSRRVCFRGGCRTEIRQKQLRDTLLEKRDRSYRGSHQQDLGRRGKRHPVHGDAPRGHASIWILDTGCLSPWPAQGEARKKPMKQNGARN